MSRQSGKFWKLNFLIIEIKWYLIDSNNHKWNKCLFLVLFAGGGGLFVLFCFCLFLKFLLLYFHYSIIVLFDCSQVSVVQNCLVFWDKLFLLFHNIQRPPKSLKNYKIYMLLKRNRCTTTSTPKYKVHTISFPDFFVWAPLLIVHTWNSTPLQSNLLWLQCTCCTVPTTSRSPHGSPLVWAYQWPSSQPLSSPQLSHNNSLWTLGITKSQGSKVWTLGRLRNCLDAHLGQIVCDKDGVADWCIVPLEMPLTRFEEYRPLPTESLPELP